MDYIEQQLAFERECKKYLNQVVNRLFFLLAIETAGLIVATMFIIGKLL